MNILFKFIIVLFSCNIILLPAALHAQDDPLLKILNEELKREFDVLSKAEVPAYYIGYRVNDTEALAINSNLGSLMSSNYRKSRALNVGVRVGSYALDNTHTIDDNNLGSFNSFEGMSQIPIEDNAKAIQQTLWRYTNSEYLSSKKAFEHVQEKIDSAGVIPDFSKENPNNYIEESIDFSSLVNKEEWELRTKKLSKLFLKNDNVQSANVLFIFRKERKYFSSTEGANIVQNMTFSHIYISATIKGEDGDIIPIYKTYFAFKPKDLPPEDVLIADVNQLIKTLIELKDAPLAEPYTGPAILHPSVTGVFFHEIFGHRIEGHRLKKQSDGQTFKEKINKKVLPKNFNVVLNPTIEKINNQDLIGTYRYDDEGVKARRVSVVEEGTLKTFLMSRSPLDSISNSNGHGRAQAGMSPVSRQSNLIVNSTSKLEYNDLREMLISECKKQEKEYGYYFVDVQGGFTQTSRYSTNAFNIMPSIVYRVFVDGRPDELVRGVDLIGTPLAMFAEIITASTEMDTFTGYCGAESGNVPVSATAPGIFIRRIETQKKPVNKNDDEPILGRPFGNE